MKIGQRIGALLVAGVLGLGGAVALSSPAQAADWGPYKLVHTVTGLCAEVPHGSMVMGEQLRLGVCGPTPTWYQEFWFSDAGSAWRYFIRPGHNLWCIRPGVANQFNSTIIQWSCGNWTDDSEVWFLQVSLDPTGHYLLSNNTSGYYLRVRYDQAIVGGYVIQGVNTNTGETHYDHWDLVHL